MSKPLRQGPSLTRRRREAGMTLVELLVSMVILGFVMTLVSEAVFQVSQVARAASSTTQSLGARWASGWSASGLLANLVVPELAAAEPVMQGTPTRIAAYSTLPIEGASTGVRGFELLLRADPSETGQTQMLWTGGSEAGAGVEPAVVASIAGRAEFAYLRRNGEIVADWPPLTRTERNAEDLPSAILLRDAGTGRHLMWYRTPGEPIRPQPIRNPFEASP